jgi:hypothetical protein
VQEILQTGSFTVAALSNSLGVSADIYLGTISSANGSGYDCDFGLAVGHSGKAWAPIVNSRTMKIPKKGFQGEFSGRVTMTLELPGFNRAKNNQAAIAKPVEKDDGSVAPGYIVLEVDGAAGNQFYVGFDARVSGPCLLKRCNTIAQTLVTVGPHHGFSTSGTSVIGATWSNLKVYSTCGLVTGTPWIDNPAVAKKMKVPLIGSHETVYPGAPYVGWSHGSSYYANETSINLSTVPLPPGSYPNPAP